MVGNDKTAVQPAVRGSRGRSQLFGVSAGAYATDEVSMCASAPLMSQFYQDSAAGADGPC